MQHCIWNLANRAGLDYTVSWHGQPKEVVGKIIGAVSPPHSLSCSFTQNHMFQAREHHNFLNQYPCSWPVEEFLKTYLKNKCAYAHKQGFLTENTNQKQVRHDEEEQEQDEDEEQEEQGDDKEQEQEQEQEEEGMETEQ